MTNQTEMSNKPNNKPEIGDYVVAIRNIDGIQERSVGLVKNVLREEITVFFIGKNKTVITDSNHVAYLDLKKTGKPHNTKVCNICHMLKDMQEFDINQTDAKGIKTTRPSCKICRRAIDRKKIDPAEKRKLDAIKPKDLFTCPVCNKTSIVDVTVKIVRDHDHDTGKAREWICDSCNTGLGRFKDNIELLDEVIDYLKKHS